MATELTREEIAAIQGALRLAMNAADNMAADAAIMGDREALGGSSRAAAYHARAKRCRAQSAAMFKLFTRLIAEAGDLRELNQLVTE